MTDESNGATEPVARKLLQQFIRMPHETEMEFFCAKGTGRIIIQRMRVKLSRLREKVKLLGRNVQEFKMIVEVLETQEDKDYVKLRKTKNKFTDDKETLRRIEIEFADLLED
jgi:hypothetical protein